MNNAKNGGVISLTVYSKAYLENSKFEQNSAILNGVILVNVQSSLHIKGCTF
jgi:hypothetical protein